MILNQFGSPLSCLLVEISIPEFSSGNVTFFQQPKLPPVRTSDRQFSNRSDQQYVPTLGPFLYYERSLLRSFVSPQLRSTCQKQTSRFSSQNVNIFQPKRQQCPCIFKGNVETGSPFLFARVGVGARDGYLGTS